MSPSKMTDDQNSQKMLVDCTHIVHKVTGNLTTSREQAKDH